MAHTINENTVELREWAEQLTKEDWEEIRRIFENGSRRQE